MTSGWIALMEDLAALTQVAALLRDAAAGQVAKAAIVIDNAGVAPCQVIGLAADDRQPQRGGRQSLVTSSVRLLRRKGRQETLTPSALQKASIMPIDVLSLGHPEVEPNLVSPRFPCGLG